VSYLVATNATQVLRPEQGTKPQVFYIAGDRNQMEFGRDAYQRRDVMDEDRRAFERNFKA